MWLFKLKLPDWLPTKEDEIQYHNEKKKMLETDLLDATVESVRLNDEMYKKEEALFKTLSDEQKGLWYDLKSAHQKANFQANRIRYMQKEIKETPNRITEILCS